MATVTDVQEHPHPAEYQGFSLWYWSTVVNQYQSEKP